MRCPGCICEPQARRQREAPQSRGNIIEKRRLPAVEMGNTRNVDPYAVRSVDVAVGTVSPTPPGKTQESAAIPARIGLLREKRRKDGARIGEGLTDAHAFHRRLRGDGGYTDTLDARLDESQRSIIRHEFRLGAAHALDRP